MNYLSKLLKNSLFALFFLILVFQIKAEDFSSFQNGSVLKNIDKMNQLNAVFKDCLNLMQEFSESRYNFFDKGLGWQNSNGYGFYTDNKSVYFNDDGAGFTTFYTNGETAGQFYCNKKNNEDIAWIVLNIYSDDIINIVPNIIDFSEGVLEVENYIHIGIKDGIPVMYSLGFSDGLKYFFQEDYIEVKYPYGEYYYVFYNNREEPTIMLSDKLSDTLFYQRENNSFEQNIINDLNDDFPYPYFVRILTAAYGEGINIKNEQELSGYTINWFREKIGLPYIEHDFRLKQAAQNHSDYLIENGIVYNQLNWDITSVDLNAYLVLHDETRGQPLFTGQSPADRAVYTGYGDNAGECATIGRFDVISENINWLHTIFHRRPYIDLRVLHFGHGHSEADENPMETAGIMNWGYDFFKSDSDVYFYPFDGETLVPYAWSGYESPDPFPGNDHGLGIPITVAFTNPMYKNGTLELIDHRGVEVLCLVSKAIESPDNFIEITPLYPLLPDTTYSIKFTYGSSTIESSFTTAPLNPAEIYVQDFKNSVYQFTAPFSNPQSNIDFRGIDFDIENAMELNNRKGELSEFYTGSQLQVVDNKYNFTFDVPEGWEQIEREWQEVAIGKSWYSINIHLYIHGINPDPVPVMENQMQYIAYDLESSSWFENDTLFGYRLEYSWEYDNKVIYYCLIFGDYALIISGYGVTDHEMDKVVTSFDLLQ